MSLVYNGKVTITLKDHTITTHNHGTQHLFKLFSQLMTKQLVAKEVELPTYMQIVESSYDLVLKNPRLDAHTTILADPIDILPSLLDDDPGTARFDALLTANNLKSNNPVLSLVLIAGDKNTIFAAVDFDSNLLKDLKEGTNAIIKWEMNISNVDDAAASAILQLLED